MSNRKGRRYLEGNVQPDELKVEMAVEVIRQYISQHTRFVEPAGSEAWHAAEGFVTVPRRLLIHVLTTGTVALHDAVRDMELEDTLDGIVWEFRLALAELVFRAGIEPQPTNGDGELAEIGAGIH